jgi:hypothetical protein
MYGLDSRLVKERVLRRHYGIVTSVLWDEEKHPLDKRWQDRFDGTWRIDIMNWYVAKVNGLGNLNNSRVNKSKMERRLNWYYSTISMSRRF